MAATADDFYQHGSMRASDGEDGVAPLYKACADKMSIAKDRCGVSSNMPKLHLYSAEGGRPTYRAHHRPSYLPGSPN